MRKFVTVFVLVCTLTVLGAGTAFACGRSPGRQFSGTVSGTVTQPSPHGISFDGTGSVTQLGRVTLHMSGSWLALPTAYDGTAQLTAANGDQIFESFVWGFDGVLTATVTGGTGRFEGATGSATGTVVLGEPTSGITRPATVTFSGTIDAADQAGHGGGNGDGHGGWHPRPYGGR